jgi:hypothetical protein
MTFSIADFLSAAKKQKLTPTATVVRGRDGTVKVERAELLSDTETAKRMETSIRAGGYDAKRRTRRRQTTTSLLLH